MMKKTAAIVLMLCITAALFAGCAQKGKPTDEVTWQQLCEANRPRAVLEKVEAYCIDFGGEDNICYLSNRNGEYLWSYDVGHTTEDYRDGVIYKYFEENGVTAEVSFVEPDSDPLDMAFEYGDIGLDESIEHSGIRLHNGKYLVDLKQEYEEYGITVSGKAVFDAETLLMESVETSFKMGLVREKSLLTAKYGSDIQFVQRSYEAMTQADDALQVTVHYPDGSAKEYRLSAKSEMMVVSDDNETSYSLCWDEACTGRIDDFGWVKGDTADLYICEGYVDDAPPDKERILERTSFEHRFEKDYDSYSQSFTYYDGEDNWLGDSQIVWIENDEGQMEYYAERLDKEGEVIFSETGVDGVWYSWSADEGYQVDFYDDAAYAEHRMGVHKFVIDEEHLKGELEKGEYCWHFYHADKYPDGAVTEYVYDISPDFDYIDYITIMEYDSAQKLLGKTEIYIGGNGGVNVSRDVREEITEPDGVDTIKLSVSAPAGEKTVKLREDAAVFYKGGALYRDKGCTIPVKDLSGIGKKTVTFYAE